MILEVFSKLNDSKIPNAVNPEISTKLHIIFLGAETE